MDKLATRESNCLVIEDCPSQRRGNCNKLGYHLPTSSGLNLLLIPLAHCDERNNELFHNKAEIDLTPLWDINWAPKDSVNKGNQRKTNAPRRTTEAFSMPSAPLRSRSTKNCLFWQSHIKWAHSTVPIKGKIFAAYLSLSCRMTYGWARIKVVAELTSSENKPGKRISLDTRVHIIPRHQLWKRFALMMSFCRDYRELRVTRSYMTGLVSPTFTSRSTKMHLGAPSRPSSLEMTNASALMRR
ncbi:hypothetical protein C8R48DRAFT_24283 [Suillus tomentosus]|nr:hypothetical protein C8R48DRAFT_24283 [Suillus tomentosus]